MANLEVAADELVRKLKSVDDEVEEAKDRFTTLKGQLDSLGDQVDTDWVELARAVGDLVEKVQEELATLGNEAQETTQAVANLEPTGQGAQQAIERLRLGADRLRQRMWRLRALLQVIGQTKLGREVDQLGDAEAHDQLSQRRGRRHIRQWSLGPWLIHRIPFETLPTRPARSTAL